jgi:hypothetical protein
MASLARGRSGRIAFTAAALAASLACGARSTDAACRTDAECGEAAACAGATCLPVGVDRVPPEVRGGVPGPLGADDVRSRDPIVVSFSEAIDPASATGASVTVSAARGPSPLAYGATWSADGRTLTLTLDPPLPEVPNTLTLSVGRAVTDLAGNPLAAGATWTWDLPAWQRLGDTLLAGGDAIGAWTYAVGEDRAAAAFVHDTGLRGVHVFRRGAGTRMLQPGGATWHGARLAVSPGGIVAVAGDVETSPDTWSLFFSILDDGWGTAALVREGGPRPYALRFDPLDRPAVAFVDAVLRATPSGWEQVGSAIPATIRFPSEVHLSFDEGAHPIVTTVSGASPARPGDWIASAQRWDGTRWEPWTVCLAPRGVTRSAWNLAVAVDDRRTGSSANAWLVGTTATAPDAVTVYLCSSGDPERGIDVPVVGDGPVATSAGALWRPGIALGADRRPIVTWSDDGGVRARRWSGTEWETLEEDGMRGVPTYPLVSPDGALHVLVDTNGGAAHLMRYNR